MPFASTALYTTLAGKKVTMSRRENLISIYWYRKIYLASEKKSNLYSNVFGANGKFFFRFRLLGGRGREKREQQFKDFKTPFVPVSWSAVWIGSIKLRLSTAKVLPMWWSSHFGISSLPYDM